MNFSPEVLMLLNVVVNGAVTWGVVRTVVNHLLREINRAHRRLDELDAPACTEASPLQI